MSLIKWVKSLFNSKVEPNYDLSTIAPEKRDIDFSIPVDRIVSNYDKNKKCIVIIDDSKGIVSILEDFLKDVEGSGCIDLTEYNVITFYDKYAAFVLQKTLEELDITKIDYAIIDIILPGKIKDETGKYTRRDGIDVAVTLNNKYQCENFVFFTGNIVSEYIEYIQDKVDKFQKYFNRDIKDFIIFKGDNDGEKTIEKLCDLVSGKKFKL